MNSYILFLYVALAMGFIAIMNSSAFPRLSFAVQRGSGRRVRLVDAHKGAAWYSVSAFGNSGGRPSTIKRPQPVKGPVVGADFDLDKWVKITHESKLGVYRIPVLPGMGFKIANIPLELKNLGVIYKALQSHPSQVWLKDDKIVLMYAGMTYPEFCQKHGIVVEGPVGKRDKRMSRLWRAQALFAWAAPRNIVVKYVERGLVRSLSQDGANWISRQRVLWVAEWRIKTDHLKGREAEALRRMARHCTRIELTFVNHEGQFKGHALVVDQKDWNEADKWDLMLIKDSQKKEVHTASKQHRVFISVESKHMSTLWIDRQSFANLNTNGFMTPFLKTWMQEFCQYKLDQFKAGQYIEMITDMGDENRWATDAWSLLNYAPFNFVLSGGNPLWFASMTRAVLKAALKGINNRGQDGGSFIAPGANYYVFPVSVAKDIGLDRSVARGHAWLDKKYSTIWVNDVDLVTCNPDFEDVAALEKHVAHDAAKLEAIRAEAPGLMQTWSGSDDDDMIRALPFIEDGRRMVLAWRSPNQLGQFAVLELCEQSDVAEWCGKPELPVMDSSLLPHPDQWANVKYLNLVTPYKGEPVQEYSLGAIYEAAKKMIDSAGAVGMLCKMLRLCVGTLGQLPPELPAEVSDVIDGAVKEFADLSKVIEKCKDILEWLCEQSNKADGHKIPLRYAPEIDAMFGGKPPIYQAAQNWVDDCYDGTREVLAWYWDEIEKLAQTARPPMELFVSGLKTGDAGLGLKRIWGMYWRSLLKDQAAQAEVQVSEPDSDDNAFDHESEADAQEKRFNDVREQCIKYLSTFTVAQWPMIMVGGLAMTYAEAEEAGTLDEHDEGSWVSDAAFWQLGAKKMEGVGRELGFADMTIDGLRQIGLIGEPMFKDDGKLYTYDELKALRETNPAKFAKLGGHIFVADAQRETAKTVILAIHGAWFNYGRIVGILPRSVRTLSESNRYPDKIKEAKTQVATLDLRQAVFTLGETEVVRKGNKREQATALFGAKGNLLGTLGRRTAVNFLPSKIKVAASHVDDRDVLWIVGQEADEA